MEHFESVDAYLEKSEQWPDEVAALRKILLGCGLDESVKWGKPCYLHEGSNIALIQEFKDFVALMFFKGALLDDPDGELEEVGPNSRAARRMQFTSAAEVKKRKKAVERLVDNAIAVEESGEEVGPPEELDLADELRERLEQDPKLKKAWDGLTPGRQRAYNLHVAGAKKAETRVARVDKHVPKILAGKGLNDR